MRMHPIVEGRMLQALDIQPTDNALEIGTGSGYVTACMAQLASHVDSIEIDPSLSETAAAKLQQQNIYNVSLSVGDGVKDFDETKKYDVICLTGSLVTMLEQYKNALTPGGRLFVILGEEPIMQAHLFTRTGEQAWADQILFDHVVKALVHGEKPRQFVF
jgi:protein-L-isoaspartate(D-aspartate) O-methyltransferase